MELTQITENIDHQRPLYYNYMSIEHMKLRVLRFNLIWLHTEWNAARYLLELHVILRYPTGINTAIIFKPIQPNL